MATAIGTRIASLLRTMSEPAVYRSLSSWVVRAGATGSIGATSLVLSNLPAGLTIVAGDTITAGAVNYTIALDATPTAGAVSVTFAPAISATIGLSSQVTISRTADYDVSVIMEQVDTFNIQPGAYAGGDYRFTVFGLPSSVEPKNGHRLIWSGKAVTIQSDISRDQFGAGWIVRAK